MIGVAGDIELSSFFGNKASRTFVEKEWGIVAKDSNFVKERSRCPWENYERKVLIENFFEFSGSKKYPFSANFQGKLYWCLLTNIDNQSVSIFLLSPQCGFSPGI